MTGCGPAGVVGEQRGELGAELVGRPRGAELALELLERGDEGLGHELPAEVTEPAERPPARARAAEHDGPRAGTCIAPVRVSADRPASRRALVGLGVGGTQPSASTSAPDLARFLDEPPQLPRVLVPGAGEVSTPLSHVDAPRAHPADRLGDVARGRGRRRAGSAPPGGAPSASVQSKTRPDPGVGESTRITSAGLLPRPTTAPDRRRGTPGSGRARAARIMRASDIGSRPCSWAPLRPTVLTISTTRSGRSSRNTPTVMVSEGGAARCRARGGGHLTRAPRREHETDRVGAHGHREERILLGGDATDLHEHGPDGTGRPLRQPCRYARRRMEVRSVMDDAVVEESRRAGRARHRPTQRTATPVLRAGALDHRRRRGRRRTCCGPRSTGFRPAGLAAVARGHPGLACWRNPNPVLDVIWDWLPILVIAAGYDLVRSQAPDLVPRAVTEPHALVRRDRVRRDRTDGAAPGRALRPRAPPLVGLPAWASTCRTSSSRPRSRSGCTSAIETGSTGTRHDPAVSLAGFATYLRSPRSRRGWRAATATSSRRHASCTTCGRTSASPTPQRCSPATPSSPTPSPRSPRCTRHGRSCAALPVEPGRAVALGDRRVQRDHGARARVLRRALRVRPPAGLALRRGGLRGGHARARIGAKRDAGSGQARDG